MALTGHRAIMRIYTDERARGDEGPLYASIVDHAKREKLAGTTVVRGVVGFGVAGHIQRASILDLSGNLPLTIEIVDDEAKLRAFFETIRGMTDIGLVTIQPIEVLHYDGGQPVGGAA